ncbi:hypothetical protein DPMN_090644 [Dreissena polymorpha]|uniref:Uncharacterized protein n=1 Tax=Dreissena polymorpha TaxID=45954 RepID=A0A9D4KY41_DREPO|nr:hypothetical protein DPMN_090644 [Dreissena polymorpha]
MTLNLPFKVTRHSQTVFDGAKRCPRQSSTLLDTPRQSTTVPRGLLDSLRRC